MFWSVILFPPPRTTCGNRHPVGILTVMPPTPYSKVRTGADPTTHASAAPTHAPADL